MDFPDDAVGPGQPSHPGGDIHRLEDGHWFEEIASHLGEAYLRYSFTKGTAQEVDFLVSALALNSRARVLDIGCGPGRHALALAQRGISVHGVDISGEFVELARTAARAAGVEHLATFERLDARTLPSRLDGGSFDTAICLCQGAFGLMTAQGEDERVIAGIRHCLRSGGRLALSAFNAYFAVKYHDSAIFDALTGVSHEITEIRSPSGEVKTVDLWTGCYTPRELRLLLASNGFEVDRILSVEPGAYADRDPSLETAEFLALATAA